MLLSLSLPFPPSVNSLFGGGSRQKRFPSKRYKEWIKKCLSDPRIVAAGPVIRDTPLFIHYHFYFPDNRVRDGQNFMKAPLDLIVNQGIIQDDNWKIVCGESWAHSGVDKENPRVEIEIYNYD